VDQPGSNWALGFDNRHAKEEKRHFPEVTKVSAKSASTPGLMDAIQLQLVYAGGRTQKPGDAMNRFTLSATILSAAILFPGAAQAMEIQQFDKLASEDKGEYVSSLVGGAEQAFKDEGRADLAAQVDHLFTTTDPGDAHTVGIVEFQLNLARARVADSNRVAKDPTAHRLEVEDAMLVTLQKNNMPLSQAFIRAFRAINNNFRPQLPPH
jgi:hypothetical protein